MPSEAVEKEMDELKLECGALGHWQWLLGCIDSASKFTFHFLYIVLVLIVVLYVSHAHEGRLGNNNKEGYRWFIDHESVDNKTA
jgi:hypothetical protein